LAAAIIFTGCLDPLEEGGGPGGPGGPGGGVLTTLFDLQAYIAAQGLSAGETSRSLILNVVGKTDNAYIAGADSDGAQVDYLVVDNGGVLSIQLTTKADWAGLDIKYPALQLVAGDTVRIAGKVVAGTNIRAQVHMNQNDNLQGWSVAVTPGAAFDKTFTLTAADITDIKAGGPQAIRIRQNSVGVFQVEQIQVIGLRAAGSGPGGGGGGGTPSYNLPEEGIQFDLDLNSFYFYVDLNKVVRLTSANSNFSALGTPPDVSIFPAFVQLSYAASSPDRPSVAFEFTAEQTKELYAARGSDIKIAWTVTHTATSGTSYRYSIGNKEGKGTTWNAMSTLPDPLTTPVYEGKLPNAAAGDNPNTNGLVFQEMNGSNPADDVKIQSIKISWPAPEPVRAGQVFYLTSYQYGNRPFETIENAYVKGTVLSWKEYDVDQETSNNQGTAYIPATFNNDAWDTAKQYPRFKSGEYNANVTVSGVTTSHNFKRWYEATIQLAPKAGYLLDGWGNGILLIINNASYYPLDTDNLSGDVGIEAVNGKLNYSYNSNNNTIKVRFSPGTTAVKEVLYGDADPTTFTAITSANALVIYDSKSKSNIENLPYQGAGVGYASINGGLTIRGRSADWHGVDFDIGGLDLANRRYRLTVQGAVKESAINNGYPASDRQVRIVNASSPWGQLAVSGAIQTSGNTFDFYYDIPINYDNKNGDKITLRLATQGNLAAHDLRVSRIILEDYNYYIKPVSAIELKIEPPVFEGVPTLDFNTTTVGTSVTSTSIVWKHGDTAVNGWKVTSPSDSALIADGDVAAAYGGLVFGDDTVYSVTFTVKADGNYTLNTKNGLKKENVTVKDLTSGDIDGVSVEGVTVAANGLTAEVTVKFKKTEAAANKVDADVSVLYNQPKIGEEREGASYTTTTGIPSSGALVGSTWSGEFLSTTSDPNIKFLGKTVYTVTNAIKADDGYTFKNFSKDVKIYEKSGSVNPLIPNTTVTKEVSKNGKQLFIKIVFPATEAAKVVTISSLMTVSGDSTVAAGTQFTTVNSTYPATGANNNWNFDTRDVNVSAVVWSPALLVSGGNRYFDYDTAYTLTLRLLAIDSSNDTVKDTFDGFVKPTAAGSTSVSVTTGGNLRYSTATITIVYPKTAKYKITSGSLGITAPVKGERMQVYAIPGADAHFTAQQKITWSEGGSEVTGNNEFAAGKTYTAKVVIRADDKCTFDLTNDASITTSGSTTSTASSKTGDTITVTVVFPATATP